MYLKYCYRELCRITFSWSPNDVWNIKVLTFMINIHTQSRQFKFYIRFTVFLLCVFFSPIDITCQRPILSIRGSLQLSTNPLQRTFSYNESISFFCTPGYILHGPTVKYCRQNGDFEQGLPFCTGTTRNINVKFCRQKF